MIKLTDNHAARSGPCAFCLAYVERTGFDLVTCDDNGRERLACFPCTQKHAPATAFLAWAMRGDDA